MLRRLLLSLAACLPFLPIFAQDGLWSPVSKNTLQTNTNARAAASPLPTNYELVKLNASLLQRLQQQAPLVKPGTRSSVSGIPISLPLPIPGQSLSSAFTESPVLSDELTSKLTDVKTYQLRDPVTQTLQGRLTISGQGVTGLLFTSTGTAYINPMGADHPNVHMVSYIKDMPVTESLLCGVTEVIEGNGANARMQTVQAGDCQLRNYKLAVAATGEYTTWAGGSQSQALTYITTLVNDVTAIYERDCGITFTLVTNNSIIFTNAAADPYATTSAPNTTTLSTNHNTLTTNLGSANFDLGIVLNNGWNNGLASTGVVCNASGKGSAAAGYTAGIGSNPVKGPQGAVFVGIVAHEIGHLFNATHTMATDAGNCYTKVNTATAWEPGSGSTIMAYAGLCSNAYQRYYDLYFHGGSILQITNYAVNSATCAAATPLNNAAPTVSVSASSYTIPASTPFMLTATGADANNNTLYYCWEQMDAGYQSTTPFATSTSGPNFRSYPPTTSNTRSFPRMKDLVSGTATPYEVIPSVSRTMNFQVLVRDQAPGGGCTAQATVSVNTNAAAGAFTVASQNTATNWTANGSNTATITWNVANTNVAPIGCTNVDILLSTDGGITFPDTLAANTTNDGTEIITIPNRPTSIARVMVKARGNIFFNINAANITITGSCTAQSSTFAPATPVTGAAGSSTLDLNLSPVYGTPVNISGTLTTSDAFGYIEFLQTPGNTCGNASNIFLHDTYRFTPSVTGSYTFTRSVGSNGCIFNLYSDVFDPGVPCGYFINSSCQKSISMVTIVSSYTVTLNAGQYYTMAVGTFDASTPDPVLPASYTISVSGPGSLYTSMANPGTGFNYTYVIVDNATGLIKAIDASADLSNALTYPIGNYTAYGLSCPNTVTTTTLNSYAGTSFATFRNALLYTPSALCGSLSLNNAPVTVTAANPLAAPVITAIGNTTFCTGGGVTLSSSASTGNQWYKNGAVINGATGTTLAVSTSGTYTAIVTINGVSSPQSGSIVATANAVPAKPTITQAGTQLVSSSNTGNQWYKDGTAINGATGTSITPTEAGKYSVKVTANGCTSDESDKFTYTVTGVINLANNQFIKLSPNPVTDKVTLEFELGGAYSLNIQLIDMYGRICKTFPNQTSGSQLSFAGLSNGVYVANIFITNKKQRYTIRLTKQ